MARAERGDSGVVRVLAPMVGIWSEHPHGGSLLGPGSRIGILRHLTRRYALVLPEDAAGRVAETPRRERSVAVEFGEILLELRAVRSGDDVTLGEDPAALGHPAGAGLQRGTWAVVSPTDGIFYARPSPDSPPFVTPGSRIRAGDTVGLVEVMKTFNPILYGGPGFPEEAEVLEVRGSDSHEVRVGQVLVVVR